MSDLIDEAKYDYVVKYGFNAGRVLGLNEKETMVRIIKVLVSLKDEVFQEKLDKIMSQHDPLVAPFINCIKEKTK